MTYEYYQMLKSNIRIMQTEVMKEYIFYQVAAIMLYSSFQQSNLIFTPISVFDTLMTLPEFTQIAIYPATA